MAPNTRVEPGDILFRIDPRPYQYRVDQLTAQLVETEAYVAQLKRGLRRRTGADGRDAHPACAERAAPRAESTTRERRRREPIRARALRDRGRRDEAAARGGRSAGESGALESDSRGGRPAVPGRSGACPARGGQFDLENTSVMAPADGIVTMNVLREGMQVSPSRAVMTFIHTDDVRIPSYPF